MPGQPLCQHGHDARRPQFAQCRQHRRSVLVVLSQHPRALASGAVVEQRAQLGLDHGTLFFHHQHFVEAAHEFEHALGLQRIHQTDLVDAHTGIGQGFQ